MSFLDAMPINFTCGECRHEFTQTVGDIRRDGHTSCPGCGHRAELDEAGKQMLILAEEQLAQFAKTLGRP